MLKGVIDDILVISQLPGQGGASTGGGSLFGGLLGGVLGGIFGGVGGGSRICRSCLSRAAFIGASPFGEAGGTTLLGATLPGGAGLDGLDREQADAVRRVRELSIGFVDLTGAAGGLQEAV